jgi:hypothetical protein
VGYVQEYPKIELIESAKRQIFRCILLPGYLPLFRYFDREVSGLLIYYIGSAEGHEYPDLQVGDEVNPRPFFVLS